MNVSWAGVFTKKYFVKSKKKQSRKSKLQSRSIRFLSFINWNMTLTLGILSIDSTNSIGLLYSKSEIPWSMHDWKYRHESQFLLQEIEIGSKLFKNFVFSWEDWDGLNLRFIFHFHLVPFFLTQPFWSSVKVLTLDRYHSINANESIWCNSTQIITHETKHLFPHIGTFHSPCCFCEIGAPSTYISDLRVSYVFFLFQLHAQHCLDLFWHCSIFCPRLSCSWYWGSVPIPLYEPFLCPAYCLPLGQV